MIQVIFIVDGYGPLEATVRAIPNVGNAVTLDNVLFRVGFVNHIIRTIPSSHDIEIHLEKV